MLYYHSFSLITQAHTGTAGRSSYVPCGLCLKQSYGLKGIIKTNIYIESSLNAYISSRDFQEKLSFFLRNRQDCHLTVIYRCADAFPKRKLNSVKEKD